MNNKLPQETHRLPQSTAFELLGHSYRLALLECLDHYEEPVTLVDVAEWVASANEDEVVENIDEETIERIHLSLYHSHVPKLEAHDVVEYHQEKDMVALNKAEQLLRYLRMCPPAPSRN